MESAVPCVELDAEISCFHRQDSPEKVEGKTMQFDDVMHLKLLGKSWNHIWKRRYHKAQARVNAKRLKVHEITRMTSVDHSKNTPDTVPSRHHVTTTFILLFYRLNT